VSTPLGRQVVALSSAVQAAAYGPVQASVRGKDLVASRSGSVVRQRARQESAVAAREHRFEI
jgi:hypothetical protein